MCKEVHQKTDWLRERDSCGIGAVVNIEGRRSHRLLDQALSIVEHLEHRAGKDASGEVGDGVGILLQISHRFFTQVSRQAQIALPKAGDYGIAMLFLPREPLKRRKSEQMLETIGAHEGAMVLGWRDVPCQEEILGEKARACMPVIRQCFFKRPAQIEAGEAFEQCLYVIRRQLEKSCPDTYVVSLSSRTIVYKGMFLVGQLRAFYDDLRDPAYESALAIVHSRFSTNTQPSWQRAQPNRMIAHNGEINTIRGNCSRMHAREENMSSSFMRRYGRKILPVIESSGSDSAMLDNTLEFLCRNGMPMEKAVMLTIPQPWRGDDNAADVQDFYHYYATMMEPWDGPAAILFSDGEKLGAVLDRNGLRPLRWWLSDDQTLTLSSEVGVLAVEEEHIVRKDRLHPGSMLLADTKSKRLLLDAECKAPYVHAHPYGEWLDRHLLMLKNLPAPEKKTLVLTQPQRNTLYRVFGYTQEDVREQILPMAQTGAEAIASMGTDIPLAALSDCHPLLFHYFKQQFAQVTNPPIDSLREAIITDTRVYLGAQGNLLQDRDDNCAILEVRNPILDGRDMDKLRTLRHPHFHVEELSLLFYQGHSLEEAVDMLYVSCDQAIAHGASLLILSDRGMDEEHLAIPSLLAVSALEHHLVRIKKKTAVSLVVESGEVRDVHQFAALLGYGAAAIYPYLAHESIREMVEQDVLDKETSAAIRDYNDAIMHGVVKIAAKMGISTLQSYQSAQIFEAIGLDQSVIERYFPNTVSRLGGVTLDHIEADVRWYHDRAYDPLGMGVDDTLDSVGFHRLRNGAGKERHLYSPKTIITLQNAVRNGDYEEFQRYTEMIHQEDQPFTIRSLLRFDARGRKAIPLDEVESVDAIVRRFKSGAMSYGSISQEAHTTLAIAMNTLHAKSNSGEGGESEERLGTLQNSAIKQVASGRFGVTSAYLNSAQEIQIKMAQGAKPGEGGHLPGSKVYPWIAKTRHSTPGVTLISPPPHHDIYSIEDLAQLIYDLKNANPHARISVKLVSEEGVGTIANGVAKAGAQVILISGYDGGTGAAPQSSIHHAGLPWELGLTQTHEQLVENGLRSRVILETDGKLMSGRDVAIAALLGAEEFGFASAPLVAMGCMMMRVCNLDTCPVGIATQNECLRRRFQGKPEHVINFMRFIAMQLREIMASLGFASVEEMVGHKECLRVCKEQHHGHLRLEELLRLPKGEGKTHFDERDVYDFHLEQTKDAQILIPGFIAAQKADIPYHAHLRLDNTDRAFATLLGSYITRHHGSNLSDDSCVIHCEGSGGQSFGAFLPKGVTVKLQGDANDYFGKGLCGGILSVTPSPQAGYAAQDNVIIGNVALYGATSGSAYLNGIAGERFAVRNSGAVAVVEGCGDHALEYMTGGCVVILGETGKNVAAGMSGGVAYILDEKHTLYTRINKELVDMEEVVEESDWTRLSSLLKDYVAATDSAHGKWILAHLDQVKGSFKKIIPRDYRHMQARIAALRRHGYDEEEAKLRAFEQSRQKGDDAWESPMDL